MSSEKGANMRKLDLTFKMWEIFRNGFKSCNTDKSTRDHFGRIGKSNIDALVSDIYDKYTKSDKAYEVYTKFADGKIDAEAAMVRIREIYDI